MQFRNMWAEFEWENKVAIATTFTDVAAFLQHIITTTNMKCLTPPSALEGAIFLFPFPYCALLHEEQPLLCMLHGWGCETPYLYNYIRAESPRVKNQ